MKDRLRQFLARLIPSGSIRQRAVKSGIWVSATKLSLRMSQVLMLIVLARLLSPRDFGLMGVALLTLSATRQFTKIGLNAALIQQKEKNVNEYLDTTWSLETGRALLIFGVLFISAPYIAGFFDEPNSTNLIRVLGVAPIFYGLRNPGVVYFEKNLSYHKEFVLESTGAVVQFVVAVSYALWSPTVWALVFGSIARPATRCVLSYVLHDYRPWPSFDFEVARELIDYGKWITGSSIVMYIYSQGDDAFVGWFLSATALGFYQYAYRITDKPPSDVSGVISKITFPMFSELQNDTDKLRNALIETSRLTAFVVFPITFGIALVAPSFVPVVLGEEWTPMIRTMQILALYGLMHGITRNFGGLWKALGRPDLNFKLGLFRVTLIAILIWPATARWGIEGTALVVVVIYIFPMLPIDVFLTSTLIECRSIQLYREFAYPFIAAAAMFGSLWVVREITELSHIVELLTFVPVGAIIYFSVAYVLSKQFDWGIKRNIQMITDGVGG